jgi:glycosyltransferase involved in cell wall biosynthesis
VRILYVATRIPYPVECGGTTHVRGVVRELMRRGHEVVLCANAGDGLEEGVVDNMPTYRFTWRYRDIGVSQVAHRWTHGLRLSQLAKKHDVDIIYERESSMGSGALAAKMAGLPLVVEVNDLWYHPMSLDRAARIVCHSGGTREHIPAQYHGKTVWVHAAVDMDEYREVEPMPIEGLEGRRGVAYTGSILAWHGMADLAKALPSLIAKVPDVSLVIAGEATTDGGGAILEDLRRAAVEAGVEEAVIALGRVAHSHIPSVLAACDLCVAPYNPAGEADLERFGFWYSPMKLWEYMASGRAVVSTDLPSIREIVGDDRGVLVPPGEPSALADAIAGLLADDDGRQAMGRAGRAFAEENTWERRVDDYEGALIEALEGGK